MTSNFGYIRLFSAWEGRGNRTDCFGTDDLTESVEEPSSVGKPLSVRNDVLSVGLKWKPIGAVPTKYRIRPQVREKSLR